VQILRGVRSDEDLRFLLRTQTTAAGTRLLDPADEMDRDKVAAGLHALIKILAAKLRERRRAR
jgi:hypothetical protein